MTQEDINEVQWKSLPQWRKDQLIEEAAHDEDIKRVGNKNPIRTGYNQGE